MSDQSDSLRHSEVEHTQHLSECIGELLFNAEYSDITLVVEDERLPAHKLILASSCDYFRYDIYSEKRSEPKHCTDYSACQLESSRFGPKGTFSSLYLS